LFTNRNTEEDGKCLSVVNGTPRKLEPADEG